MVGRYPTLNRRTQCPYCEEVFGALTQGTGVPEASPPDGVSCLCAACGNFSVFCEGGTKLRRSTPEEDEMRKGHEEYKMLQEAWKKSRYSVHFLLAAGLTIL